jgi:hypothetical protein
MVPIAGKRDGVDRFAIATQNELWCGLTGGDTQRALREWRALLCVRLHAEHETLVWVGGQFAQRVGRQQRGLRGVSLVTCPAPLDQRDEGE